MYKPLSIEATRRVAGQLSGTAPLRSRAEHNLLTGRGGRKSARLPIPVADLISRGLGQAFAFVLALAILIVPSAIYAAAPGTVLSNTAYARFTIGAVSNVTSQSNTLNITTTSNNTTAVLGIYQYAPTGSTLTLPIAQGSYSTGNTGGPFVNMPDPVTSGGAAIDLTNPVPLAPTSTLHMGEPVFITITDGDQNLNPTVADTVTVTITVPGTTEREIIVLTETGPDTGVFVGYIQTAKDSTPTSLDGTLALTEETSFTVTYVDDANSTDTEVGNIAVDPLSRVFDSRTGLAVDGASITIVYAATGQPATVYGDNSSVLFPSTITSGGTVTDNSGAIYTFQSGTFRFPYIPAGSYRYVVAPPIGYTAPSIVDTATLQTLPGAPYTIVSGSRGESFTVSTLQHIAEIDIPLDPMNGTLYVRKEANKDIVSIGDFLQYKLTITETAGYAVYNAWLKDILPLGFRYQGGSLKVNGLAASDPTLSSDGRTLLIPLGDIASRGEATVSYVVEVAAGAKLGMNTNTAAAYADHGVGSNVAGAAVEVRDDFFMTKDFLMGRIVADACGRDPEAKGAGVEGIRVYLEDGTYVVSDKNGMFHFEGITAGTHIVQVDLDTVPEQYEVVACQDNTSFSGRAFSKFIDLQGGSLWRVDFNLALKPRATGDVSAELRGTLGADVVDYKLILKTGKVPLTKRTITVMLPDGASYLRGTSTISGQPVKDPEVVETVLIYRLEGMKAESEDVLGFEANVSKSGKAGEILTKVLVSFDTPTQKSQRLPVLDSSIVREVEEERGREMFNLSTNFNSLSAELTPEDKARLDEIVLKLKDIEVEHLFAFGNTDNRQIQGAATKLYKDNYDLSRARARTIVRYLGQALGLAPVNLSYTGQGSDKPVADNETEEGRAKNRRVDIKVYVKKVDRTYTLKDGKQTSGLQRAEIVGDRPGEGQPALADEFAEYKPLKMPEYDAAWLKSAVPGFEVLWPTEGYVPPSPAVHMSIKHDPKHQVRLYRNGEPVNNIFYESTTRNAQNTVGVSLWRGVHITEGDNNFEAVSFDSTGSEVGKQAFKVHYATEPVYAEYLPDKSRLVADGKTEPVIAVRLTDKDGYPARPGLMGEYRVEGPHLAAVRDKTENDGLQDGKTLYTVGLDGIALIRLAPTAQSGKANVVVYLKEKQKTVTAWLKPVVRDWILVGLAEGTAGYNMLSGNMENLEASDITDGIYQDGRVAFFAKGKIKGDWLLTMAYDSAKPSYNEQSLNSTIDPDSYYMLYGDGSTQQYEASSSRRLYLKIEREKFYALFGDYDTGMTVTELSRYSRRLNGIKSEYEGEEGSFVFFVSDTNQAFMKDEIRGDGTSGLYTLTKKDIVMNSEKVVIEVRDRNRSEEIISTTSLTRHIDYEIDYDEGTLFFKEPVPSLDGEFNPVYIVVDYESYDDSDTAYNYGGRGALKFFNQMFEVGASVVHEASAGKEGDLVGVDATVKIGERTTLKAEAAKTKTDISDVKGEGTAYKVEVAHEDDKFRGSAYFRSLSPEFGLGQQSYGETGTRKVGGDATYKVDEDWSFGATAYRQTDLTDQSDRTLAEAKGTFKSGNFSVSGGLRHVADTGDDGGGKVSDQMTAGAAWSGLDNKLLLKFERDQSVFSNNDSEDYPTATRLKAEYRITESMNMFASQELAEGDTATTAMTTMGLKSTPWKGGEANTSIVREMSESGMRTFSTMGLAQNWDLSKRWSVSAGLDRTYTLSEDQSEGAVEDEETQDYTALSLGLKYNLDKFTWQNRVETRFAEDYDKYGIYTSLSGEPRTGLGLSVSLKAFQTDYTDGYEDIDADLRFGVVHRPFETDWIVLDRLDLIYEKKFDASDDYSTWRIVNNLNVNYMPGAKYQVSFKYGNKYVKDVIEEGDYKGYTDFTAVEAAYYINDKWDISPRIGVLHSWSAGQMKDTAGLSVGRTMAKNIWLSLGYNFTGFKDRDFSASDFTAMGPYIKFRIKFDQISVREALNWL